MTLGTLIAVVTAMNLSQIVYISNRPEVLNDTLRQVKEFMTFIDNILILAPGDLHSEFINPGFLHFSTIADEDIFNSKENESLTSHSFNNYHLRASLISHEKVEDVFLMSDDDYRPIKNIQSNIFIEKDKFKSYFFYDLRYWRQSKSSYDHCLINSYAALTNAGLATLAYSSHMPQVIQKPIFKKAFDHFSDISNENALCEWSIYFNYAQNFHKELFYPPEIYQTMCWPPLPGLWPEYVVPSHYSFENYYEENYSHQRSIFQGLSSTNNPAESKMTNFEKLRRLQLVQVRHTFPPPIKEWTTKTPGRLLKSWFLRQLFKIDRERNLHLHSLLLENKREKK